MKSMQKIERLVQYSLMTSPKARDDDFLLVCMVYTDLNETTRYKNFEYVMMNHKLLGLPSFESITRARRKLQSRHPELCSSKRQEKIRAAREQVFRDYANNYEETPF